MVRREPAVKRTGAWGQELLPIIDGKYAVLPPSLRDSIKHLQAGHQPEDHVHGEQVGQDQTNWYTRTTCRYCGADWPCETAIVVEALLERMPPEEYE